MGSYPSKYRQHSQEAELKVAHIHFNYIPDEGFDDWRIHKEYTWFSGDCEDFALTLLYRLSGMSMLKFWWNVLTLQAVFWYVIAPTGQGHAVLWYKGKWADNTMKNWYTTAEMPHKRRWPYPGPALLIKFAVSRILSLFN
jgi:hypothetical protein